MPDRYRKKPDVTPQSPSEAHPSVTNKHGTVIRIGQQWADNDPRCKGRTIRITAIEGDRAVVVVLTDRGGKRPAKPRVTTISVDRLHPTSTGYRLLSDHEGEPDA